MVNIENNGAAEGSESIHTLIKKVTLQQCMSRVSDLLLGVCTFVSTMIFGVEYECPSCGAALDGEPEQCPSCGRQLL